MQNFMLAVRHAPVHTRIRVVGPIIGQLGPLDCFYWVLKCIVGKQSHKVEKQGEHDT